MHRAPLEPPAPGASPAMAAGAAGDLFTEANEEELALLMFSIERGDAPAASQMARHILRVIAASARLRAGADSTDAGLPVVSAAARPGPAAKRTARGPTTSLSPRELQVLGLVARGWSNRKIAEALSRSASTIDTQVKSVYRKLAVRSRVQAVREATQRGLLSWDERAGGAH